MALRWAGIGSPVKIGQLKPASSSSSADPADHIPIEADRGFRIVTAYSGLGRKSVNFEQNPRSASSRITGQVRSESAVKFVRNTQEERMKSLNTLPAYVIGVFVVWALVFGIGYFRYGSTPGHPILHVFGGFLLGMLSMYIATRVYPSKRKNSNT